MSNVDKITTIHPKYVNTAGLYIKISRVWYRATAPSYEDRGLWKVAVLDKTGDKYELVLPEQVETPLATRYTPPAWTQAAILRAARGLEDKARKLTETAERMRELAAKLG